MIWKIILHDQIQSTYISSSYKKTHTFLKDMEKMRKRKTKPLNRNYTGNRKQGRTNLETMVGNLWLPARTLRQEWTIETQSCLPSWEYDKQDSLSVPSTLLLSSLTPVWLALLRTDRSKFWTTAFSPKDEKLKACLTIQFKKHSTKCLPGLGSAKRTILVKGLPYTDLYLFDMRIPNSGVSWWVFVVAQFS